MIRRFDPRYMLFIDGPGEGWCEVPQNVAACSHCQGPMTVYALGWDEGGVPSRDDLALLCERDKLGDIEIDDETHDAVYRWILAIKEVGPNGCS